MNELQGNSMLPPIQAAGPFDEHDLHLLRQVVEVLYEFGTVFWLDQGALLGIVRDGRLIPWDTDIDLGVWDDDIREVELRLSDRLEALAETIFFSNARILRVNPRVKGQYLPVSIHRHQRRSGKAVKRLKRPAGTGSLRYLVHRVVVATGRSVIRRPGERLENYSNQAAASDRAWWGSRMAGLLGTWLLRLRSRGKYIDSEYLRPTCEMSVDVRYFERLRPVILGDIRIAAPADTEAYLELKYGPNWREPSQDWTYWQEDGAVTRG